MTAPLYNYLEGMGKSRQQPGGYTTMRPGTGGAGGRQFGGLAGTLGRLAAGRGGGRPAVYQPITPTAMPNYSGKMGGAGAVGIALKGIGNVMQAIENYKAAQDMLAIAQEERDAAKEKAARELMEKTRAPLIALAETMKEMPEEERAAFGEELLAGGEAQGLDPASMNLLKLTMQSSLKLPSEAESAGKKALAEEQGGKFGELTGAGSALAGIPPEELMKLSPEEIGKKVKEYLQTIKPPGTTVNVGDKVTPPSIVQEQSTNVAFLRRLDRIQKNFKPEYVGSLWGLDFDGIMTEIGNKRGTLSPEAQEWYNDIAGLRNMQIRKASGATVPVQEVPRLDREIGKIFDSDTGFVSKLNVLRRNTMDEIGVTEELLALAGYKNLSADNNTPQVKKITGGGTAQPEQDMSVNLPYPIDDFIKNPALINELDVTQSKTLRRELSRRGIGGK